MLTKDEADRIANAITALRPDWNHAQLMAVLGDTRLRERRTYRDAALAFTAMALDPATRQPTRIYEQGPWWQMLAPTVGASSPIREIQDDDCGICSRPKWTHVWTKDHEWEPQHARTTSAGPTDEQRAAIAKAATDAKLAATAAREAEAGRVLRDPGDVVAGRLAEEAS